MSSHRERKSDIHAAGVILYWRVEKLLHLREVDNFVEFAPDLGAVHPEDSAVKVMFSRPVSSG